MSHLQGIFAAICFSLGQGAQRFLIVRDRGEGFGSALGQPSLLSAPASPSTCVPGAKTRAPARTSPRFCVDRAHHLWKIEIFIEVHFFNPARREAGRTMTKPALSLVRSATLFPGDAFFNFSSTARTVHSLKTMVRLRWRSRGSCGAAASSNTGRFTTTTRGYISGSGSSRECRKA